MTIAALRAIQDEAKLTTKQLLENADFLAAHCKPQALAERLDTTVEALTQHYRRAELAWRFEKAAKKQRRLEARLAKEAQ